MTAHVEPHFFAPAPEVSFHRSNVYLCLLVNQTDRAVRIIDFRAGPSPEKRRVIETYAREHGIERLFTLVERDEVSGWARLGFEREGNIPGYYKRSDAYVLGMLIDPNNVAGQSGTRPAAGVRAERIRSQHAVAEEQYQLARKVARGWPKSNAPVRVSPLKSEEVARIRGQLVKKKARALTSFEPFSRDGDRWYFSCTARGGHSVVVSIESQPCFNNAYLELLTAPGSPKEAQFTIRALDAVTKLLKQQGIVSCFATAPVAEVELSAVFLESGFRRSGLLSGHLRRGPARADAFLWSRKLALPDDG